MITHKNILTTLAASLLLLAAGCSRTVEDVSKWKAESNIPKLKGALTDPKEEVRKAAADSLGALKAEEAVEVLAACLNDPETSVQSAAVDALIAINSNNADMPLIAALKLDSIDISTKAADALGTRKSTAAISGLAEALNHRDPSMQLAACNALAKIGDETSSAALVEKMNNPATSQEIMMACLNALADTGGDEALTALVNLLADNDPAIRDAATSALLRIGSDAAPSMVKGLRSPNPEIRTAAIKLLRGLNAIPRRGDDLVWYQLARATIYPDQREAALSAIAEMQDSAVSPLLDAAGLPTADLRDAAACTLCLIGESCTEAILKRLKQTDSVIAANWMNNRDEWAGAPSPLLDLWAAAAALNPELIPDRSTTQALQDGGSAAGTVMYNPDFVVERVYIPYLILNLGDSTSGDAAKQKLAGSIEQALLPLIAAISSTDQGIAEGATDLLTDRTDPRMLQPLMAKIEELMEQNVMLSNSPLYSALIQQNELKAEALLLKVRPNTNRAIQVFSRQFRDAKITSAMTDDRYEDNEAPVTFHFLYRENEKSGSLEVTFKKDEKGNWYPSPALPYKLPTKKK